MSGPVGTVAHVTSETRVSLDITDGPVLRKLYGKREYRVTSLRVTYQKFDDEDWRASGVALSGPYVKKDGSDGADMNRDSLWSWSGDAWIVALVEAHMPGGTQ